MNDHQTTACNESFTDATGTTFEPCFCKDCRTSNKTTPTPPLEPKTKELVITIKSTNEFPVDKYTPYQQSISVTFGGMLHKSVFEKVKSLHSFKTLRHV